LVTTVAVMVAANVVRGISYDTGGSLLVASLLLGILNALLRPLLLILSLPLVVLTLGLFVLVINALLLGLVGQLVKGFQVAGFWPALLGAVIISLITMMLNTATGSGEGRIDLRHPSQRRPGRRDPPSDDGPPGKGPFIDV
jgi:putative membrane protein